MQVLPAPRGARGRREARELMARTRRGTKEKERLGEVRSSCLPAMPAMPCACRRAVAVVSHVAAAAPLPSSHGSSRPTHRPLLPQKKYPAELQQPCASRTHSKAASAARRAASAASARRMVGPHASGRCSAGKWAALWRFKALPTCLAWFFSVYALAKRREFSWASVSPPLVRFPRFLRAGVGGLEGLG